MDNASIVKQCRREYENGLQYKQGRVSDWRNTEDLYYGKTKKVLPGRFNVPMPIMSGFIDTLMSKIDDAIVLRFKPPEESEYRKTKKAQSFYDKVSTSEDADFETKDLDGKKLAIFSGRAIFKTYGESLPKFKFNLFNTDHYDFFCDPMGGGNLENHRFLGEDNIFLSKSQLIAGAKAGFYDKGNVGQLINNLAENTVKDNDNAYKNKMNRLQALGLSNAFNFAGEGMNKFIEQGTIVNGKRYKVLYNYETVLPIRCVPLTVDFKSNLWWWVSWATHRDSFNFWSKAPADDIRPIAEIIKIMANQELDNRQKKNWGMRAYDPELFPNSAELEFRPGGLVATKSGASKVQPIGAGIYEFQTPELNGTINLVQWLDQMQGKKSGVTADIQGSSQEDKVAIYQGNMQAVIDRLGLYNKSYVKGQAAIGRRFLHACAEHLNKSEAVKLIGENGVEWDTLKANEVNPDMDIKVESGTNEMKLDEVKGEKRTSAIALIIKDPALSSVINPKWKAEQLLRAGSFEDEDIKSALDTDNYGNREILAKASECIELIVQGKTPKLVRAANTAFVQKILDFALDNTDNDLPLFTALTNFAKAHYQIVNENTIRLANQTRSKMALSAPAPVQNGNMPMNGPMNNPMNGPNPGMSQ